MFSNTPVNRNLTHFIDYMILDQYVCLCCESLIILVYRYYYFSWHRIEIDEYTGQKLQVPLPESPVLAISGEPWEESKRYSLCKNIRSNFSLHILSYIHDIAIPTRDLSSVWSQLQL